MKHLILVFIGMYFIDFILKWLIIFALIRFLIWYCFNVPIKFLIFQCKTFLVLGCLYLIKFKIGVVCTPICMIYWFYMLHKRDDWDD